MRSARRREGDGAAGARGAPASCAARRPAGISAPSAQDIQSRRALRALAVVVATVLVVVACGVVGQRVGSSASASSADKTGSGASEGSSYVGRMWEVLLRGGDFAEALEEGGLLVPDESDVPSWFTEEVLDLGSLDEIEIVAATVDWSAVYLSARASPEEALASVVDCLSESGWAGYDSGLEGQATFVKEGGSCTWALVACSRVGEETSVVMRVRRA